MPWKLQNHCLVHIQIVRDYSYAVRRGYSSPGRMGSTSTLPCVVTTHHPVARVLPHLRRTSECFGTLCGLLSTTSPTLCVWVPQHVARLVVDYFASFRLVIYYFAHTAHPSASARRAARHRLLRLRRVSGYLGTSRGLSSGLSSTSSPHEGSSSTTSPTPRVWVPRRLLRAPRLHLAATLALLQPRRASRLLAS
jgi:hypothetical protein